MSTLKAKQDQIRQQLNLKNLQRHDPLISEIVTSASYASVYENYGEQWVKTGVEGPMFLFSRTKAPHYGFFVLNRQGLEYIQEFLTPDCELSMGGEFILFESGQNVDKATGIWIFDETERASLCKRMEQLKAAANAVAASASTSNHRQPSVVPPVTAGQSVSLDLLFASSKKDDTSSNSPAPSANAPPSAANPLDLLFLNAAARNSPQQAARHAPGSQDPSQAPPSSISLPSASSAPPSAIPKTLEQLFAAASPVPQSATLPIQALSQAHLSAPSPSLLPNTLPKNHVGGHGIGSHRREENRGMSLLDSIFASAEAKGTQQMPIPPQPAVEQTRVQVNSPSSPPPQSVSVNTRADAGPSTSGDARALLAMLGHTTERQPSNPPAQPSTTLHPAPFQMEVSPSQPPSAAQTTASSEEMNIAKEDSAKPLFAAPLLSHDVFANFPLSAPKTKKTEHSASVEPDSSNRDRRDQAERSSKAKQEEEIVNATLSQVEGSLSEILKSAPVPVPSITPTRSALQEEAKRAPRTNGQQAHPARSPEVSKSHAVDLVDSVVATHESGATRPEASALQREEFMQQILDLLKKPSVQMQLYGKYLERLEESQ